MTIHTIRWEHQTLTIVDQTQLPGEIVYRTLDTVDSVWEAIKSLRVRGAPAIGVCAAYGLVVGARTCDAVSRTELETRVHEHAAHLASSRPTAVNLRWALDRMLARLETVPPEASVDEALAELEDEAVSIHKEDRLLCEQIGKHGAALIEEGAGLLTHCNAGALATAGIGTALAPMYIAHDRGVKFRVYADETRPLLQGSRLTAWELQQAGVDVVLICDNMAATVMREGRVQLVITGADRIAANGDTANKIGTYGLALLARAHGIPFYVAAPYSTIDRNAATGAEIPIEEREAQEVRAGFGIATAPDTVSAYNPAFDVTSNDLIHGIITERGILRPPFTEAIAAFGNGERNGTGDT